MSDRPPVFQRLAKWVITSTNVDLVALLEDQEGSNLALERRVKRLEAQVYGLSKDDEIALLRELVALLNPVEMEDSV